MFPKILSRLVSLSALLIAGLVAANRATADDWKPYLSAAAERESQPIDAKHAKVRLFVPTADKIGFIWTSRAFALNIPIEVPACFDLEYNFSIQVVGLQSKVDPQTKKQTYQSLKPMSAGGYRPDARAFGLDSSRLPREGGSITIDNHYAEDLFDKTAARSFASLSLGQHATPEPMRVFLGKPPPGTVVFWIAMQLNDLNSSYIDTESLNGEILVKPTRLRIRPRADADWQDLPLPPASKLDIVVRQDGYVLETTKVEYGANWNKPISDSTIQDDNTSFNNGDFSSRISQHFPAKANRSPYAITFAAKLPQVLWDHTPWEAQLPSSKADEHGFLTPPDVSRRPLQEAKKIAGHPNYSEVIVNDVGQIKLLDLTCTYSDWKKIVHFFGRRLSEIKSNIIGKSGSESRKTAKDLSNDGYWKWLETAYLPRRAQTREQIQAVSTQLSTLAGKIAEDRRTWCNYMAKEMDLFHDLGQQDAGAAGPSRRLIDSLTAARMKLKGEMASSRAEQEKLMRQAVQAMDQEIADLKTQAQTFSSARPEIKNAIDMLDGQKKLQLLKLYDLAQWYRTELPQLLNEVKQEKGFPLDTIAWLEIRSMLGRADDLDRRVWLSAISPNEFNPKDPFVGSGDDLRLTAYGELRKLLANNPKNVQAQEMLKDLETRFLKMIQAKIRREQSVTAEQFGQYLEKRGFSTKDSSGWTGWLYDYVTFAWGAGPLTIYAAFPEELFGFNVPEANAQAVGQAQQNLAQFDVSLVAILRLRKNGLPLEKIRQITPDLLRQYLTGKGKLSDAQCGQICRDIRETFIYLGDLRALAEGNIAAVQKLFPQQIFDSIDVQQDWGEFAADIFSPRHLLLLASPMAVARVGGEWQYFSTPGTNAMRLLQEAGKVERGGDLLIKGLRLEAIGKAILGQNETGWLRTLLRAQSDRVAGLNLAGRFMYETSKLGAMAVLMGGAWTLADEYLDTRVAAMVHALIEIGAAEMFWNVLVKEAVPLGSMAGQIDRFLADQASKEASISGLLKELDQFEEALVNLDARSGQAGVATPGASMPATLQVVAPAPGVPVLPGNEVEAWGFALEKATAAWKAGDYKEALRALQFSKRMLNGVKQGYGAMKAKAAQAKDLIQQKLGKVEVGGPRKTEPLMSNRLPELLDKRCYQVPGSGDWVLQGDRKLQSGDLKGAIQAYRTGRDQSFKYRKTALDQGDTGAAAEQNLMTDLIDRRLAMTQNTHSARVALERWTQNCKPKPFEQPIAADHIEDLKALVKAGVAPKQLKGSLNPVFELQDAKGNRYIFKHIGESQDVEGEFLVELTGSALARELGIPAPAVTRVQLGTIRNVELTRVKMVNGQPELVNGKPVMETFNKDINSDGILMPFVSGEEVLKMRESVAQALNDKIGQARVFRAWLGDPDGHLRNLRLAADGRLCCLDFGMGNLRDDGVIRQIAGGRFLKGDGSVDDAKYLEWVFRFAERAKDLDGGKMLYSWLYRYDVTMRMHDVEPLLEGIDKLCADNGKELRRVLGNVVPPDKLEETVRVLMKRGALLRDATQEYLNTLRISYYRAEPGRKVVGQRRASYAAIEPAYAIAA